ncbi:microgamete surface protein MiGS, putative [Plasmodium vivax]|uniref:Microgamete surface protein MiGS, putative n=1 Tax=Plasmodium vivax TaxID=5855 RepID=A0A565A3A9_PLAVI|nr:microgamete surface protein MiGS, putative [Plasmodium vivax]
MGRIAPLLLTLAELLLYAHNATVCSAYHLGEAARKKACKYGCTGKGNSLVEAKTQSEQDYFTLKLSEHNFRWSVRLLMGSKKTPLQLGVVTSTPITALYCSYNASARESDQMKDLKYGVNESEDVKYVGCKSRQCTAAQRGNSCAPINHFLKMIHEFGLRKKNCTSRFCSYINDMNFLNVDTQLDKRNMSVCSFSSTVGSEHIEGFYFKDSFYLHETVRCSYNYFGCLTQSDDLTFNNAISGFIGLAYNRADDMAHSKESPSMMHTLVQKSISKRNVFTLCFVEGGGFASFGGVNNEALRKTPAVSKLQMSSQHLEADAPLELVADQQAAPHQIVWLAYSDTSKDTYSLLLKEVNLVSGSKRVESAIGAVALVDSYSYFLSFPAEITAKLKTAVHSSCAGGANTCSEIINKGVFTLKNQGVTDFPALELVFDDGKVLIEPQDYLIHEGDGVYRVLLNSEGTLKLGVPFFLNKYLIFDNERGKLGVGPSDCTYKMKETFPGVDLSTPEADSKGDPEDEDCTRESFFQANKLTILALTSLSVVGGLVGGVFFFC